MRLLLDTNVLLWVSLWSERLTPAARAALSDPDDMLTFSVVSIWEVAIKAALQRDDFDVDPAVLRRGLLDHGFAELNVIGQHAVAVATLPALHRDPFDRLLIAQAMVEGLVLVTSDPVVAQYPATIRKV